MNHVKNEIQTNIPNNRPAAFSMLHDARTGAQNKNLINANGEPLPNF